MTLISYRKDLHGAFRQRRVGGRLISGSRFASTRQRRQLPFALALATSAALHFLALVGPGWGLPEGEDAEASLVMEAVLANPKQPQVTNAKARQRPRKRAVQPPSPPPQLGSPSPEVSPGAFGEAPPHQVTESAASSSVVDAPADRSPPFAENLPAESQKAENVTASAATPHRANIALPEKGRIRYAISRGTGGFMIGQSVYTWEHDGMTYKMQSVTETTGLVALFKKVRVVQNSQGDITADGLRPHEFRHERATGIDTASFDWTRRVVSYAGREDRINDDTQDMLSMYCQLVLLVPEGGSSLEMPIATGRKLEKYRFELIGEEVVSLAEQQHRAIHLRTRSGNDTIEVWIAPDIHGLPIKIRFTDRNGEIFDQQAKEIETAAMQFQQ